jgi:signal transduction histidine kinase
LCVFEKKVNEQWPFFFFMQYFLSAAGIAACLLFNSFMLVSLTGQQKNTDKVCWSTLSKSTPFGRTFLKNRIKFMTNETTGNENDMRMPEDRMVYTDALNKALEIFVSYTEGVFDEVMSNGLRPIADASDMDRIIFFRVWERDRHYAGEIYRWDKAEGGTAPVDPALKILPVFGALKRWISLMSDDTCVSIRRSEFQEDEAAFLFPRGVMSISIVPVFIERILWGVVTFHDYRNERDFDSGCVAMLRSAARLCAATIIREEKTQAVTQAMEALKRREEMVRALNSASVTLLSNGMDSFSDMMTAGVQPIADMADIDRMVLYRNTKGADGLRMSQVYRWDKKSGGSTELIPSYLDVPYARLMPGWEKHLENGNPINALINQLSGPESAVLKSFGIVSAAVIPIFINNIFWGFMLFGDVRNERCFEDDIMEMLRSAAFLFANAFMRADMEREIAKQNELTSVMFSTAPIGFSMFDENYKFLACNDHMAAMCNVTKEYFVEHFFDLSPEYQSDGLKSSDKANEILKRVLNGETVTVEWTHCTGEGEPIPCEITVARIKNEDKYIGLGYVYDLRSIKKLEKSVIEAEERVKLILDTSPLCCVLWGRDKQIVDCNESAVKLLGAKNKQDIFDNFFRMSPEYQPDGQPSYDKFFTGLKKAFDNGSHTFEWTHQLPDGKLIPTNKMAIRFDYKGDYITAVYTIDMREHKRMIDEIESALFKAQAANRAKSEFLSRMSHEMLTPMNIIMGMTQWIPLHSDLKKISNYTEKITGASRRLLQLIHDLLDMSGMEDGTFHLTESAFSFGAMFQDALKEVEFLAIEKRQQLAYSLDPAIPASLQGDSKHLAQVIINLLTNAIKFSPEEGSISFSAQVLATDNGAVILKNEITDTGIGISREEQSKLFSVFEQLDGGLTRKYGGTGLGLAYSRSVIELMGGKIWVDSEPGKGAKFTFTCRLRES